MFLETNEVFAHPFCVRALDRQISLNIEIFQQYPALSVDSDHLSRTESPLLRNGCIVHIHGTDFRADNDEAVACYFVAAGSEAVAVERCCDCHAITEDERCRTIPRFAEAFMIFEEGTDRWVDPVR